MQRQTAVTAYLKSKQLLLFAFARQYGARTDLQWLILLQQGPHTAGCVFSCLDLNQWLSGHI